MDQDAWLRLLLGLLALTVVGLLWLVAHLLRWGDRQRAVGLSEYQTLDRAARRERAQIAQDAEAESIALLEGAGYALVASQERAHAILAVDGEVHHYEIKPDHLVEKNGALYVADVKTGREASLGNAKTRRQLLEYQLVFRAEGALLIDMVQRRIQQVHFLNYEQTKVVDPEPLPIPTPAGDVRRLSKALGAGVLIGAVCASWWLLH